MSNIAIAPAHRVPGYVSQQQTYQQLVSPFLDLPGLIGLWYGGNYQRSTGDMPNLAPYISGASSQDLSYNGNPNFDYLSNGVGYVDLDGTGDYFSVADNTDLDVLGTESYVANPGLTVSGWFQVDSYPTANVQLAGKTTFATNNISYRLIIIGATNRVAGQISDLGTGASTQGAQLTTDTIAFGDMFFAAMVFSPSNWIRIYLNNVSEEAASVKASLFNSTAPFNIGSQDGTQDMLDGRFSICALCSSALNNATIQALFEQTRSIYGV